MKPNPGHCPVEACGNIAKDNTGPVPPGWPADGRGGCRWTITGSDFDIAEYEVIG